MTDYHLPPFDPRAPFMGIRDVCGARLAGTEMTCTREPHASWDHQRS